MRYAIELIEKEIERLKILLESDSSTSVRWRFSLHNQIESLEKALDLILFNNITKEQDVLLDKFNTNLDAFNYKQCKKAYDQLLKSLPEKHFYRRVLDMQIRQFPQERTN